MRAFLLALLMLVVLMLTSVDARTKSHTKLPSKSNTAARTTHHTHSSTSVAVPPR